MSGSAGAHKHPEDHAVPGVEILPNLFDEPSTRLDRYLAAWIEQACLPGNLRDAIRYAALGGGKRLRPVLAWHACVAVGGRGEESLPAGAAIELIHAFSLVHDDLPALDNDDLRRGRPTLHRYAGEAMAILAGDSMMACAVQLLLDRSDGPHGRFLASELVNATQAMIGGQVLDTLGGFDPATSDADRLAQVHSGKTGALITAALVMGAACAMPDLATESARRTIAQLREFGAAIGLKFQIVDDLIDVEQTTSHTGKRTGKDAAAGKLTYPSVFGVEGSRATVAELTRRATELLAPFGERARSLAALTEYLSHRTK